MRRTWLPGKYAYFSSGSAICGLGVGLEPLLGPVLAVLGRSWALCWRSWAALGAYVGGLGSGSGPKLAVLGGLGAEVVGLGSDQGEKWPKPERERDPQRVGPAEEAEAPRSIPPIFSIDTLSHPGAWKIDLKSF